MGTVAGLNTRRYHGHLVAAVGSLADRMVLLDSIEAHVDFSGFSYGLSTNAYPGAIHPQGYRLLERFVAGDTFVEWTFGVSTQTIVKRLTLSPGASRVEYRNEGSRPVRLGLRPLVAHKPYHQNFTNDPNYPDRFSLAGERLEVEHHGVILALTFPMAFVSAVQGWYYRFEHAREAERGLDPRDDLFCPCELAYELAPGSAVAVTASYGDATFVEPDVPLTNDSVEGRLEAAARRFIVTSPDGASIVAGYPWFADWGRDTMIALPGLCLHTGQVDIARTILLDSARQMKDGLIPNRSVEGREEPDYNTVDATLWMAEAVRRTLAHEWNEAFAVTMLDAVQQTVDSYRNGTHFGIRMDESDGLIRQGVAGAQLTWMDAKIGDWVVTPRHGKPIEISGLWINALRVLAWLKERLGRDPKEDTAGADQAEESFHRKFWSDHHGWYFDTIEPYDAQLRPNQLIPLALPLGPLDPDHARRALAACEEHLATPFGLRTLAPFEVHYQGRFRGPLHDLDAAYHQGTVWPWLKGIYWMASERVHGVPAAVDTGQIDRMLMDQGLGGIAECYDGDSPQGPGGCPFQAWSVGTIADVLLARKPGKSSR